MGFSRLIRPMAYSMVAKTTTKMLHTATATALQGIWKVLETLLPTVS